ncbi:SAM-dependent methyltransferase [Lutibacter sp.]
MNYKKNKLNLDKSYWEELYNSNRTGWDIGYISTPIKEYIDQLDNIDLHILIPGAGNSYEAEYLHKKGFKNVDVIDIATQPLNNFKKRVPSFPKTNLIQKNFFSHQKKYDLIIEQTFFSSLHPTHREKYVHKMHDLLSQKGKLVGIFFDVQFSKEGPPYGGSLNEYLLLFSSFFTIRVLDKCYNSIKPRFGRELFFIFEKK